MDLMALPKAYHKIINLCLKNEDIERPSSLEDVIRAVNQTNVL